VARIAIIGGGLAGLSVAFRRIGAGDEVLLLEGASRFGGQLWTERTDGLVVEHGAEGFVSGSEAVPRLARELGIEGDLVGQVETRSFGFDRRGLVPLAPGEAAGFLGFQVGRGDLGKGIRTFRLGMGQLTEALEAAVRGRVDLRPGVRVDSVEARGAGLAVRFAGRHEDVEDVEDVDAVVVATTAATAAPILSPIAGAAAAALAEAETVSSCTVTLAFDRGAIDHALDGTGFVVAVDHQVHGFRACTFITSKFADRAPAGVATLRVFFRPSDDDIEALDDAAWIARAEACLGTALPLRARAKRGWVSRWRSALPVFTPVHQARVAALEAALPKGVVLAGSAFHGSGIDAAVRSADAASLRLTPS